MLFTLFLKLFIDVINAIFSWFPTINVLPVIFGQDMDAIFSSYWGMLNTVRESIWVINIVMIYFVILMGWKASLMLFKFIFGHRAPHSKTALR